jgi:magnesium transporter
MDITSKQLQHQEALEATASDIALLLGKQQIVQDLSRRQSASQNKDVLDTLLTRQHDAELKARLRKLHPADIAYVLEGLSPAQRERLWNQIDSRERGAVIVELSDSVRAYLLAGMSAHDVLQLAETLDMSRLAEFLLSLEPELAASVQSQLESSRNVHIQNNSGFPADSVGSLMDQNMIRINADHTLTSVMILLREKQDEYRSFDQIYIVSADNSYLGCVDLKQLLFSPPDTRISEIMEGDRLAFYTDDPAVNAVSAFERYDMLSAPVLNIHNQVVGNISVYSVMDFMHEASEIQQLKSVGLSEEEEIFTPVWKSAKNRWVWLGLNLMTAFFASRVIGMFEATISHLVALATLMPLVASVGGNTGNQTVAIMIRGLSLKQINRENIYSLFIKEAHVGMVNGLLWGLTVALFAYLFYGNEILSLVLLLAMVTCLLISATAGVFIPYLLSRAGRDPVMGSNVLLTAVTDSAGFFIFLGLASLYLT